jgi:hypothetical protein
MEPIHIQIFWDVTDDPWYPGFRTLTVAPEPSIEQVVVTEPPQK